MCAAVSSYVYACSAAGISISGWRETVCGELSITASCFADLTEKLGVLQTANDTEQQQFKHCTYKVYIEPNPTRTKLKQYPQEQVSASVSCVTLQQQTISCPRWKHQIHLVHMLLRFEPFFSSNRKVQ